MNKGNRPETLWRSDSLLPSPRGGNFEGRLLNGNDHPLALSPTDHKSPLHGAPPGKLWRLNAYIGVLLALLRCRESPFVRVSRSMEDGKAPGHVKLSKSYPSLKKRLIPVVY